MKIYPEKLDFVDVPDLTDVQKRSVANEIIFLRQEGLPDDNYKGFKKGDFVTKHHIVSIVTNKIMQDRKFYPKVVEVFNAIENERMVFDAVDLTECKDLAEYKNKLAEKKTYLDESQWADAMKEKYGATVFSDLKEILEGE